MRPISALICTLALSGCAAAPSINPVVAAPPRIVESGGTTEVYIDPDTRSVGGVVAGTRDAVWKALIQSYQEIGIPVTSIDEVNGILGNRVFDVSRRLNGKSLSTYLGCGSNLSGEIANNGRVRIDLLSQLRPVEGGTRVETRVIATARSNEGTSTNATTCNSTGRLEELITSLVRQKVGG